METIVNRKQTAFRLSADLLDRLRTAARKENRSLNNYVESVLMDIVYNEPNDETKVAIKEARIGSSAGIIEMTNFDTFIKSINHIE